MCCNCKDYQNYTNSPSQRPLSSQEEDELIGLESEQETMDTIDTNELKSVKQWTSVASRICVHNQGGFVLKWHMVDAEKESDESEHYPIEKTKCMDIA